MDLDLRTGYAFSRFLTNTLRGLGGPLQQATISYGMFPSGIFVDTRLTHNRLMPISHLGLRGRPLF